MSKRQMVMNYVPGEECRVAIVEDGRLEEFHAERMDGPSNHVGNIYVGKVANVEPGIQAAFVDFGLEHNGFLHTSDVHPQYFPGEDGDKTERVGRKTPRRERPPIQDCFRRGDEVAVQVLKEGVGTKGPTVTSYLSIPGRFLVMMPQMDKVGVSRKVEDEETRRKMRDILDQLELPEGFGFILRTAGFDRTKAELKRDLAYLMRLWKDMEKRWRTGSGKPRLLYSESDLLVRALRDMLTAEIEEIVVDNEAALNRAARFLKIVSPRTSTKLVHFTGKTPIYHALGIEPQIQMIHAREVPLPSGGRLVIDEAEALVAIDVNSGKMRDARDAEATAYKTNMEACDEICRQLRLRDVGGVIVNDFIDMRHLKHRRELETRMRENLKKDRARSTIGTISEFGILEMTRQRMRASHESQHFADCPTCRGRGLVQKPDSVAAESLRELAALVDHDRVARVEMVVHPRIAGELLSTKRRSLSRVERSSGKHVDVRVSDAIAVDRITFYAYDDRGADLDLAALGRQGLRESELKVYEIKADAADDWTLEEDAPESFEHEQDEETAEPAELHPIEIEPTELSEYNESRGGSRGDHRGDRRPDHRPGPHSDHRQDHRGGGHPGHGEFAQEGDGERRGRRRRRRGRRGGGGGGGGNINGGMRPQEQYPAGPGGPGYGPNTPYGGNAPYPQHDDSSYEGDGQPPWQNNQNEPQDGGYQGDESGLGYAEHSEGNEHHGDGSFGDGSQNQYAHNNGVQPHGDGYAGGPDGQGGEGGQRRRRRRRRGRRGRGGMGNPGQPGYVGPGDQGQGGYGQPQPFDQYGQPINSQSQYEGGQYDQGQYDQGTYDQQGYGSNAPQEYAPQNDGGEYTGSEDQAQYSSGEFDEQQPSDQPASAEYNEQGVSEENGSFDPSGGSPTEQGERPRRRRRRGGRGRNRGDRAGDSFAQNAPNGAPDSGGSVETSADVEGDTPEFEQPAQEAEFVPEPVQDAIPENDGGEPSPGKRGRGGRGGRGGGRGRGGRGGGGGRGERQPSEGGSLPMTGSSQGDSASRPAPKPAASAPKGAGSGKSSAQNAGGAKPVRTLYGGSRRKLAPGDIKGAKREE